MPESKLETGHISAGHETFPPAGGLGVSNCGGHRVLGDSPDLSFQNLSNSVHIWPLICTQDLPGAVASWFLEVFVGSHVLGKLGQGILRFCEVKQAALPSSAVSVY